MKNKLNFLKHRYWIRITILLILSILFGVYVQTHIHDDIDYESRVCGGDWCFMTELARTQDQQQQGLMNRESMNEGSGMLFIFQKSEFHNFRMKNTLIPLDMIWIDEQFKVVKIMTAQPCITDPCPIYQPGIAAKYVLEINAEMAEKHGIQE